MRRNISPIEYQKIGYISVMIKGELFNKKFKSIENGPAKTCPKCCWTAGGGVGSKGVIQRDCIGGEGCLLGFKFTRSQEEDGVVITNGKVVIGPPTNGHKGPYLRSRRKELTEG